MPRSYVTNFFRSLETDVVAAGACTAKPCFGGFKFDFSPQLYGEARRAAAKAGRCAELKASTVPPRRASRHRESEWLISHRPGGIRV